MVLILPESSSATRFAISASHAACTSSSTFSPRLEQRFSQSFLLLNGQRECLFQQLRNFIRHLGHRAPGVILLSGGNQQNGQQKRVGQECPTRTTVAQAFRTTTFLPACAGRPAHPNPPARSWRSSRF